MNTAHKPAHRKQKPIALKYKGKEMHTKIRVWVELKNAGSLKWMLNQKSRFLRIIVRELSDEAEKMKEIGWVKAVLYME